MIRMVQRRLIIPRGDTGSFSIPYLKKINQGDVAVFTIFDVMTHTKLFQKVVAAEGDVLNVAFSHNETVNLQPGKYLWDIKIYTNPQFVDDELVNGEEIDSYYAGFSLPECEIRETGDSLLMSDDTPQAKLAPDQIDLISAAITATQTAKEVAMNSAADAETSASTAATSAQTALDSKDAALASQTSAATSESNAAESAAAAQESATRAAQIAQQIHEEIPTKVSDLVDDSGHYTKPATGIPASDLEETYLTSFTEEDPTVPEWAKQPQKPTYTAQEVGALPDDTYIPSKTSDLVNDSDYAVDANYVHTDNNYTTAEKNKLEGIAAGAEVNVNADWNAADGDAFILNKPTKVSDFTNDVGYLTEHQDISGKANSADLAAVATSGSYEDLSDKPTIPEVPVQDVQIDNTSILVNGIANIPKAGASLGLVRINSERGINISNGMIFTNKASTDDIKTGTNWFKPIVPYNQYNSVFYGLATAAGDTTQSESDNAIGAYTDSAKAAIQTMLDVPSNAAMSTAIGNAIGNINSFDMAVVQELPTQDISTHTIYLVPKTGETNDVYDEYVYINDAWEMVGNTQIDLSNYVQKTDYASTSTAGVVKYNADNGISVDTNGIIKTVGANASVIKAGTHGYRPIIPAMQHSSTFYGLAKAAGADEKDSTLPVGQYTDTAKAAIRTMIGATSSNVIAVQDTQPTDIDTKIWLPETAETPVQIPTMEDLGNYVQKTDYATSTNAGVVKTGTYIQIGNDGAISPVPASTSNIKAGTNFLTLVPARQHAAVFYGLAKASGDTTQSASDNEVGTYTDEAKSAIRTMIGSIGDVQINGSSVVQNGIANFPIADQNVNGIMRPNMYGGTFVNDAGQLNIVKATAAQIKTGTNIYCPITPSESHTSAFYGLAKAAGDTTQSASSNAVGTYTDNAKASIKAMLGIQDGSTGTVDITGTTPTITAVENTRYVCGEVTSLSFTPPASGIAIVRFTSGTSVTVLTIPSTVKFPEWFDPTSLETNTIYEICVTDGVYGAVMSWAL